ncbi:MAG TPA: hypothetical protein VN841_07480 [Bryobacteraceae bacterium]|nr:hypothetical protein [Bryobacteraceae bacterium]
MVAYVRGGLFVLPLTPDGRAAGAERMVTLDPLSAANPVWISNREIAYSTGGDSSLLRVVEAREGAVPRDAGSINGEVLSLARSSTEGTVLATNWAHDDSFWRVDLKAASPRLEKIRQLPWNTSGLRLTPDGKQVVYHIASRGKSQMLVSNLDGTNARQLFELDYAGMGSVEFSPDGSQFAFGALLRYPKSGWDRPSVHLFVASLSTKAPRRLLPQYDLVELEFWSTNAQIAVHMPPDQPLIPDPPPGLELQVDAASGASTIGVPVSPLPPREQLAAEMRRAEPEALDAVVGKNEVYFIRQDANPPTEQGLNLYRFDPANRMSRIIVSVGFAGPMQLSTDGRFLYLERHEPAKQQAVTIQGLK